ncbi:glycosyltransferase [Lithospermum erythrorhizon]|uniref:Glycosyltransferase n=1 Tax=Lithospermum erythrorhizon TaxID=34254 RepID=A0AAV3QBQ8_LITER
MIFTSSLKFNLISGKLRFLLDGLFSMGNMCKVLLMYSFVMHLIFILFIYHSNYPASEFSVIKYNTTASNDRSTNINHIVFGLFGSEKSWHRRRLYAESWWCPNMTRGYIYLDEPPKGDLLPWSSSSPPYRVSDQYFTKLLVELHHLQPVPTRIVHGIMEVFRDENGDMRWLVIGDDDSIFLVDNLVDVLSEYDHTKYYYLGGQSEFILSNFYLSFDQGFGGGGLILSYPLAKALSQDMGNCLQRYAELKFSDQIIMKCIADIGVSLSPHKGIHQIDLRGDISGFLSAHPQAPLISLHHLDEVKPIFPSKGGYESALHLMKAASFDQSRMLQQTICYDRQTNWSFSISWRSLSTDPCEAPHVFFLETVEKTSSNEIRTVYSRANPRGLPVCSLNANHSADFISRIEVFSPTTKRVETGRCECCDIVNPGALIGTAKVIVRQCRTDEIIA